MKANRIEEKKTKRQEFIDYEYEEGVESETAHKMRVKNVEKRYGKED